MNTKLFSPKKVIVKYHEGTEKEVKYWRIGENNQVIFPGDLVIQNLDEVIITYRYEEKE